MDTLNTTLLSIFAKNERFGQDVYSLHRRYQSLTIIYTNLGVNSLIFVYNLITWMFFNNPDPYLMFFVCCPLALTSLHFLRNKDLDAATTVLVIEMHASGLIASYTTNVPLVGIYSIMMYPFFIFSLTSSLNLHILSAAICAYEYYFNIGRVIKIFEVTLTDEQTRQINLFIYGGVLCCITAIVLSVVQKAVESNIWKFAQENYLKSENLTKEVIQAMEAKDTFVSMLSHEIRNPLNSLKGSIDYLLQVVKDYDYVQVLRNAKMSGDILLNLVSNVLDAAKLKSDKMEITYMETNVVETMKKVYSINSEKFKEKRLSAQAFIDESVPSLIWIDPSRLLQILMNLVSNAVKFTPQRGRISTYVSWCQAQEKNALLALFKNIGSDGVPRHDIEGNNEEVRARSENESILREDASIFDEFKEGEKNIHHQKMDKISRSCNKSSNDLSMLSAACWESGGETWNLKKTCWLQENNPQFSILGNENEEEMSNKGFLKIQISDTGCGIDENELSKIFGMFEQASQGTRSVHGGTGLGLWICKQLCQKMNGDITVYSKHGQGSSFVLYIPVDNNKVNSTTTQRHPGLIREKIKGLVVDDYSVNRYLHKLLLEQEGVQVTVACNGKEAVEKYKDHRNDPFDFIMMDVQMPEMDGFMAANLIREWEAENDRNKVDIYFVTGEYYNEEEVMSRFRHRGGSNDQIRCLRKPLEVEMIHKMVAQYKMH